MKRKMPAIALCVAMLSAASAYADAEDAADKGECPTFTQSQIDNEFGPGTSNLTKCLEHRKNVKSVVNMSSAALNKAGSAQQLINVRNMVDNYRNMYGMAINDDFTIVIVGHGAGGRWLVSDAAYNKSFGVTTGNPNKALLEGLVADGVPVYMCQNTMRAFGWKTSDILPGVKEVPAGVTAVVDFAKSGYVALTP